MTAPAALAARRDGHPFGPAAVRRHDGGSVRSTLNLRRAGLIVLALQLAFLLTWSVVRAERFALTWDFSVYFQAWSLLAHGSLDPYSTVHGFPFWQNHGELLLWPLALLGAVWPSPVALLVLQSAGIVGAELVAFEWMCDLAAAPSAPTRATGAAVPSGSWVPNRGSLWPMLLPATGLLLLVADPWVYWSVSFDFHFQLIGLVFLLLAARTLFTPTRSKLLWLWVGLSLLSGDVVTTYLFAIGVGAALGRRPSRRRGLLVSAIALAWVVLLTAVHANRGSGLASGYGYLAAGAGAASPAQIDIIQIVRGMAQHPRHVWDVVSRRWVDVYAAVAPGGLLGIVSPLAWVAVAVVLAENSLNHYLLYLGPGFQNVLLYVLVPVGTVDVLARLHGRAPRLTLALCAVVAANVVGWGIVWMPRLSTQWLRVSPGAASVLASVEHEVSPSAEVVAWQGVAGPFSGRRWIYPVLGPGSFPVHSKTVWVIVAPAEGIEVAPVSVADAFIGELAGPLHARLAAQRDGVWAFRWAPPASERTLVVPSHPTAIAAWSTNGVAGRALTTGPIASWRAVSTGKRGYVVAEDYWSESPGWYRVSAAVTTSVPLNLEVWNATGDVLLGRRVVQPAAREQSLSLTVDASRHSPPTAYGGAGAFRIDPILPPYDNHLEIRIWTPGGGKVSVGALGMRRVAP